MAQGQTMELLREADRDEPRCRACGVPLTERTLPHYGTAEATVCRNCAEEQAEADDHDRRLIRQLQEEEAREEFEKEVERFGSDPIPWTSRT